MNRRSLGLTVLLALSLATLGAALAAQILELVEGWDGVTRYQWSNLVSGLRVELRGEIEFTDDDRDVQRISSDGHLRIEERSPAGRHELAVEPGRDGSLRYTYYRDGKRTDFDQTARAWLAERLPEIIRESGIGAEARVARILNQRGANGVLEEISRIRSSSSATVYCIELVRQGHPSTAELERLARQASDGIGSSGDRARFLIAAAEYYLDDRAAATSYFEAAGSIASSGDHARVLLNVLYNHRLDEASLRELFHSAGKIRSSGDKARVLVAAARQYPSDGAVPAFFEAADSIASSGDHARVLISLLEGAELAPESIIALLRSARGIASSGDKARVLIRAADFLSGEDEVVATYRATAETIASSGDQNRALAALVR